MTRIVLPLRTWLALSHLFVLLLPLAAVIGTGALAWDLRQQTATEIEHQAAVVAELVAARALGGDLATGAADLDPTLARIRDRTLAGFRVVDADGVVLASSGANAGEDLSTAPEVAEALQGAVGRTAKPREPPPRFSPASQSRGAAVRLFVAVPVLVDGEVVGAVVANRTPREEIQALYQLAPRLWLGALLALAATMGLGLLAGHLASRSLVRMASTSHRIADGSIAGTALMARPSRSHVRETRDLARAVSDMAARLQERLGYIREFAGNVSHEFKTPLSTLKGTIELLADDTEMPPEQRQRFLDNAAAEVERMSRLVAGLLALARAEERGAPQPVDLDALVAEVAARHSGVLVEGSAGAIDGHPAQLEVALDNLLENARRYGGPDATVRVRCSADREGVGIDVIDDGPGITQANLPRVTQRFFTTARAQGGTGLGLALVEAICRAHRGALHIESRPGHTRMRLALPRR